MTTANQPATGIIVTLCLGLVLGATTVAWSDQKGKKDKEPPVSELVKDAKVSIDQAIKTASEKVQGTIVEAELEKEHGKTVWEVEVLESDGSVTKVHIDAGDGSVIDTEKKEGKKAGKKGGKKKD